MSQEFSSLLKVELVKAEKAEKRLQASYQKSKQLIGNKQNYNDDELEVIEGLLQGLQGSETS